MARNSRRAARGDPTAGGRGRTPSPFSDNVNASNSPHERNPDNQREHERAYALGKLHAQQEAAITADDALHAHQIALEEERMQKGILRRAAEVGHAKAKAAFSAEAVEEANVEKDKAIRAEAQAKHAIEEVKLETAERKALIERAEGNLTYIENEAEAKFRQVEEQANRRFRDSELRAERMTE